MNNKLKVLWVGEANYLKSGYAVYTKEILTRLHKTNKYELAEFASYGEVSNNHTTTIPWKYYGNLPKYEREKQEYQSDTLNQFGKWRFNEIILDFKPDVVVDIRDWWMFSYQQTSVFRDKYHWCIMPTVDAEPQPNMFLDSYNDADSILLYSEYGKNLLQQSLRKTDHIGDVVSPGVDTNIYKPHFNKSKDRSEYGLQEDIFIVGTVMRNQRRKLFPDLFAAFAKFLRNNPSIAHKIYLYLHTSYPDSGWNFTSSIQRYGLSNKVLITYICPCCQHVFPAFFQDACVLCPRCKQAKAIPSNTRLSLTEQQMATIYNCMDIYVQYAINEGFGMPIVEAAACGVPIAAVNYSAMESLLENLPSYSIPVQRKFCELLTMYDKALPDNDALVSILTKFFALPESHRLILSKETSDAAHRQYNWDNTAQKWEKHLDSINYTANWSSIQCPTSMKIPDVTSCSHLSNYEFVKLICRNILGYTHKCFDYFGLRLLRDLNLGITHNKTNRTYESESSFGEEHKSQPEKFTRKDAINRLIKMRQQDDIWRNKAIQRNKY